MRRLMLLSIVLLLTVAACGSSGDDEAAPAGGDTPTEAVIVDVRTPEEYAEGHLDGAVLIDVNGPDFADRIADLDPTERYAVYCRTGNRSAQAATAMTDIGLEVDDLGGLQEAAETTGLDIVT